MLTPSLGRKEMDEVEAIHFRALRIILQDYRKRMNIGITSL